MENLIEVFHIINFI